METQRQRGRPRTFDRSAALDAAIALFWRQGYEGTSIADLTGAMGVTPPTLYAAFGSKEQLYRAALERYASPERRAQQLGDGSAFELIERFLYAAAEGFTDPTRPSGCMLQTATLRCAPENEAARATAAELRASAFAVLVAKLEWARAAGELPQTADTNALARFYSAIVQGMSVQAIDGATAAELRELADLALAAWPGQRPAHEDQRP